MAAAGAANESNRAVDRRPFGQRILVCSGISPAVRVRNGLSTDIRHDPEVVGEVVGAAELTGQCRLAGATNLRRI